MILDLPKIIDEASLLEACENDPSLKKVEKLLKKGKFLESAAISTKKESKLLEQLNLCWELEYLDF